MRCLLASFVASIAHRRGPEVLVKLAVLVPVLRCVGAVDRK